MGSLKDILMQRAIGQGQPTQAAGIGGMLSQRPAPNYAALGTQNPIAAQLANR